MLQKVLQKKNESYSKEATHAACLALLVEFVAAFQRPGICPMCQKKVSGNSLQEHGPGCAVRRADALLKKQLKTSYC